MAKLFGAVEAGGTKFICAVGTGPDDLQEVRFPTTSPTETFSRAIDFFSPFKPDLAAIGVGSFGPVDLHPPSPTYGYITSTPKPGWANCDFVGTLVSQLNVPVAFDTDVNAAALGEMTWGAAQGLTDFIYLTIGTGIGGGVVSNGQLVHGLVHTELGHILLPRHAMDTYDGKCPYHKNLCFEGLASGPAIEERWGKPASELEESHPAWDLQAHYLALAVSSFVCTLSPRRIIFGGGVMEHPALLEQVRGKTIALLNGYIQHDVILRGIDTFLVSPGLGSRAGVLGALVLAMNWH